MSLLSTMALAISAAAALPQLSADRSIPLTLAVDAAQAAMSACAVKGSPTTVEIVDLNGLVKVLLSSDGARTSSFEYARRKAYTVLRKGVSSGDCGRSLGTPTPSQPFEGDADLIQYAGGLPILRGPTLIGAIAVSGPTGQTDDETCAQAGLTTIAGRLQPGDTPR